MSDKMLQSYSQQLGKLLIASKQTITTAESCTGGWIAKVFTDISGSSAWFETGFVTYSNQAKQRLVDVSPESLAQWGAVSEQVVHEMALGAVRNAEADFAISVSGIAGPGGGSTRNPVGSVWFAFASRTGEVKTYKKLFSGDRESVRYQAVEFALLTAADVFFKIKLDTV